MYSMCVNYTLHDTPAKPQSTEYCVIPPQPFYGAIRFANSPSSAFGLGLMFVCFSFTYSFVTQWLLSQIKQPGTQQTNKLGTKIRKYLTTCCQIFIHRYLTIFQLIDGWGGGEFPQTIFMKPQHTYFKRRVILNTQFLK